MLPSALLGATLAMHNQTPEVDPNRLKIGRPGEIGIELGWTDLVRGRKADVNDFVKFAQGHTFAFLGEFHTQAEHHLTQAAIIEALAASGRDVVVGFEMFTRPNQENLNPWTMGWWTPEEFVQKADWKTQWGFDFKLYQPIFEVVKARKLPMVALNVPRDWVRTVGRGGPGALSAEQKAQVPELFLKNAEHKQVFQGLMGGHPVTGPQGENMYAAQVLWDEGMADTAIKYVKKRFGSVDAAPKDFIFVIVCGGGHGMYEQGINWRIKRHTGKETATVIMLEGESGPVSRGLADFVYLAKPVKTAKGDE